MAMASPSPTSSYAPSSSAVTIPTPGRSILKRPPPTQQSFFSRFSKFLPTPAQAQASATSGDESKTLKRAHFILPELVTVYPISSANPPSMPTLKEEKKSIEQREMERRRRVVRGSPSASSSGETDEWWSMDKVESFYRECSTSRDDQPSPEISAAFKNASGTNPRTLDLSGVQLTPVSAAVLSDVFTIEWGLRRLTFRECDLDDRILKPILHALLIPNSLLFLSVASNRRLKAPAFRILAAFISKSKSLQFLDLSQNTLDKKAIDYISAALPQAPEVGLSSLKLDDCQLRATVLEALAHVVRTSSLRNISLRHNRINASGAVAIALMIRDYPDVVPGLGANTGFSPTSSAPSTPPMSPPMPSSALPSTVSDSHASSPQSLISTLSLSISSSNSSSTSMATSKSSLLPPPTRSGPLPPPPKHPSTHPQTTYTPYIPRSRRAVAPTVNPLSPTGQHIPLITSSQQGGVTMRHPVPPNSQSGAGAAGEGVGAGRGQQGAATGSPSSHGPSAALLDKVRALDALPRLGALRTLDLRGNDIRGGITYIAQVLKRNRTLKVLNLSENKLDMQGLVSIAEALKYNSCLETLDLSKNPCCGPGFDGVQSLRTAFTLNTALKRLFLSSTSMTSAGAIALAEFLPESTSLLHLDLTMNQLDLAGVMALNSGLKANHVMRCLDLNIPPGDEAMARMCRDILNTCVRNTEEAERSANATSAAPSTTTSTVGTPTSATMMGNGRAQGKSLWNMIEESELAKSIKKDDQKKVRTVPGFSLSPKSDTDRLLTDERGSRDGGGGDVSGGRDVSGVAPGVGVGAASGGAGVVRGAGWAVFEQNETELIDQAKDYKTKLESMLASIPSSSSNSSSTISSTTSLSTTDIDIELIDSARKTLPPLANIISSLSTVTTSSTSTSTAESARLADMLELNDGLTDLISKATRLARPNLKLQGLGLELNDIESMEKAGSGSRVATPSGSGGPGSALGSGSASGLGLSPSDVVLASNGTANGHATGEDTETETETEDEGEPKVETPKVDKGKGRAIPEPEEPEKVLSPTGFALESDEEGESELGLGGVRSPTDRSKSWVEEEGEVFRKGTKLLGPEEMEGEYAGEELRIELLEAMVDRPPPRSIVDEFGADITPPDHPSSPVVPSPKPEEPSKPPPRPYIPRRSSSASTVTPKSATSPDVTSSSKFTTSPVVTSPISTSSASGTESPSLLSPTQTTGPRPYMPRRKSSNASFSSGSTVDGP
ncbi:uncharacterized protein STEHIDRAFT_170302 [Stereum hirsutum FP-91666 SS1]|uniref:uncharacterized protein n=1 Tax=Stereum hirsutum (strain FP-91666) TaxID=721885 RepID=UPI000444A37B|nr:uncharacterized protein STEHIDRAFT_170302 [Stereum hirsutum FP-91666 SS1]EIM83836.1 hypothetical protein STEHIDRAFT_170302 [Stereum hirsutum FP-91666 SS1]